MRTFRDDFDSVVRVERVRWRAYSGAVWRPSLAFTGWETSSAPGIAADNKPTRSDPNPEMTTQRRK